MSSLFTVIIAEKEHINAIQQENKLFFEPFLENKELAFCSWDPMGQNIQDSVPGLFDVVGRRKEWRAVIVNRSTDGSLKRRNPYDVVDYSSLNKLLPPSSQPEPDMSVDDWEQQWSMYYARFAFEKEKIYKKAMEEPFQKLVTWLCFKPEDYVHNDVKEKQDVQDWAMEKLGRDDMKPSVRLEIIERNYYKNELRMKENIRRDFIGENYLNISYPKVLYCICPRSADNNYFDPSAYWNVYHDTEYSSFAERNMYFDRMRFMVFDMLSSTHRNFRSDYIRFLTSLLIFATNPIPGSAMQPRRLYQLDSEVDDAPLCTLVTSFDKKLALTYASIENEMEKIRGEIPEELTDKAAEELFCTSQDIPVTLDQSCDPSKVFVEKDYGFFFDTPENEFYKWNKDFAKSEKELSYIVKQQSRSIRKSVNQMHYSSNVNDAHISRLTPLQIDDIRDYTNSAEDEMIDLIPSDLSDTSLYTKRLSEESDKIRKVINRRMTKQTTVILTLVCLGVYLICFMPFIFANISTGQMAAASFGLSMGMVAILGLIMLISLFFLRYSVTSAVNAYNAVAQDIVRDIHDSMKKFSKYLSAICNVRRGHAVQNYSKNNVDFYTKSLRIRRKHQEDIRKKRADIAELYGDFLADSSYCDDTMSQPYTYDFDEKKEYEYAAPFLKADYRQIEFISNGNYVTVPSRYVTKMLVRMEEIYEK